MIETNLPEENDSQSISVLDSDDENGTSACVTHSPRNCSNYQVILLAFRMLEGLVEKCESLRSVDLMVRSHTKIEQIRSLVAVKHLMSTLEESLVNQDYRHHSYSQEND